MGIGDIFSKVWDFVSGAAPIFGKLGEIVGVLGSLIKIGVSSNDVVKIRVALASGRALSAAVREWADEFDEALARAEDAISDDGEAGDDITASEALAVADEFDDLGPASKKIADKINSVYRAVRDAL